MTGPVKPPSSPPGSSPIAPASSTPGAAGTVGASKASFREDLATTPELPTHRLLASALADVKLGEIATAVREGRIGPAQVVDAIVERATSGPVASLLTPEARGRLEEMLRDRLAEDPALATLVADLGRIR